MSPCITRIGSPGGPLSGSGINRRRKILEPVYTISPSTSSVNEGSSVTFTVTTTNVADGTTLYWTTYTNSGTINTSDFNDSVETGSFTITSGSGTITRTLASDNTTEGSESFGLYIRTGSTSGSIVATSSVVTISDTSTTPSGAQEFTSAGTYSWVAPAGVSFVSVICIGGGSSGTGPGPGGGGGGLLGGGGGGSGLLGGGGSGLLGGGMGVGSGFLGGGIGVGFVEVVGAVVVAGLGFGIGDTMLVP